MSYHEGSNWQAKKEDEGKPLYGEDQFQKEVNRRLSPTPQPEPVDAANQSTPSQEVDAGKVFDENADATREFSNSLGNITKLKIGMSREKFIEVFDKFRKPDVGSMGI